MKKIQITKIACAVSAGLIIAGGLSVSAQTVIWSDTFPGSSGSSLDSASTAGISGEDGGGTGALPKSAAVVQTLSGSGGVNLITTSTSGGSGWVRFDTIGSPSTLYDWSTSPGATDITAAGGMSVSFNWTSADTTSGNWIFVEAGASSSSQTTGGGSGSYTSPYFNGGGSGILFKNNGGTGYTGGTGSAPGFSVAGGASHTVTLDYSFTSWAVGAPVTVSAIVDGNVAATDSYTWQNAYNYISIGTYQENGNVLSNLEITTVPEPTTWAIMAAGLGMLVATRRFRRSNA